MKKYLPLLLTMLLPLLAFGSLGDEYGGIRKGDRFMVVTPPAWGFFEAMTMNIRVGVYDIFRITSCPWTRLGSWVMVFEQRNSGYWIANQQTGYDHYDAQRGWHWCKDLDYRLCSRLKDPAYFKKLNRK